MASGKPGAVHVVDYRHIIGSPVRKPQAFRRSELSEGMFPREAFRRASEALDARLEPRRACRVYVGLLHLAPNHACEAALAAHLDTVLAAGSLPDLEIARAAIAPPPTAVPEIMITPPDLSVHDSLFRAFSPRRVFLGGEIIATDKIYRLDILPSKVQAVRSITLCKSKIGAFPLAYLDCPFSLKEVHRDESHRA